MNSCGVWFAKYMLCIFNFLFFVLGTVVLGTGIWLAVDKASLIALLKMVESDQINKFTQPAVIEQFAYVLIACGAVMFLLSFLGYCGAIRESKWLLSTYGVFMILLLITEITAGGLAFGYKDRAKSESKTFLQTTISKYYSSAEHSDAVTLMWDKIMTTFSCCGVNEYEDFNSSPSWLEHKGNMTIPAACCVQTNDDETMSECTLRPTEQNSFYKKGCYEAFTNWTINHREIVIGVLVGVAVIQLFAIFTAFCLCKSFAKYEGMRL